MRRLRGALGRAAGRTPGREKRRGKAVKAMAYAVIVGGVGIAAYGALGMSLPLVLVGASFIAMGTFTRSMMWDTKDISEKIFEGLDKLLEGQEKLLEGQDKLLEGQDEILKSIRGPIELDDDGEPVEPDYAKNNLMSKMDELIAAVNRLADKNP